jgi:hypothetical protein
MKPLSWFLILLVSTALGCNGSHGISGSGWSEVRDRAQLDTWREDILAMAENPVCVDSTDCRTIGLGAKPCGGPWEYLIYSVSSVDTLALAEEVANYNDFNAVLNQRYGWLSDCSVPRVPTVGCRDGKCVDLDQ